MGIIYAQFPMASDIFSAAKFDRQQDKPSTLQRTYTMGPPVLRPLGKWILQMAVFF